MSETPAQAAGAQRPLPACALDADGLRGQRDRYARLSASVAQLRRTPETLQVSFAAGFDRDLLGRTLALERECCPFFRFELDEAAGSLWVSVARAEQRAALDALAFALGGAVAPGAGE